MTDTEISTSKIPVVLLALLLFGLTYWFKPTDIILHTLSFLVLLEIVRTVYEYTIKPNHRIKLRYMLDGAILFSIRELFIGLTLIKNDLSTGLIISGASMGVIGLLIAYRIQVIKSSPYNLEHTSKY